MFDFTFLKNVVLLFSLSIVIFILCLMLGPGCATAMPSLDIKTWAGDSKNTSVSRSQDQKTISCKDPLFDEMICMTYEDLKKIFLTFPKCKEWSGS